ncbi:MAG: sigma-70 family RNA polymerase sigma factor [Clostridia bacterium]|nr:sigma-70 family RNA polymerase sigma factor [Clostridia bacterium]
MMTAVRDSIVTEEYALFSEFKETQDSELRKKLIEKYLYIAQILSKKFVNRGIEYDDIYQVASMGIMYAVDRFDPDRGVRFATYATPTVLGEIRKYFRDKGSFIRVPRALYEIFYKAEKIRRQGDLEEGGLPEIARVLNIPVSDLEKAYKAGDSAFIKSLEYEAYADGQLSLSNVLGVEDNNFIMIEDLDFIESSLKRLNEKERQFIKLRYYEDKTQTEIAQVLNVSQMQVSRIEKTVLKKLRDLYFRD